VLCSTNGGQRSAGGHNCSQCKARAGTGSVPWSEDELSGRKYAEDRDMIFGETLEEFRRTLSGMNSVPDGSGSGATSLCHQWDDNVNER